MCRLFVRFFLNNLVCLWIFIFVLFLSSEPPASRISLHLALKKQMMFPKFSLADSNNGSY